MNLNRLAFQEILFKATRTHVKQNTVIACRFFISLASPPGVSQVALVVKNPPMKEMQEMWVRSLGQEDPLEEGMATHSSTLAWRIP